MLGGIDMATEVPLSRWDHGDMYDPAPDSFMRQKAFTKHGSFIDGAELFEPARFSISLAEARVMDPSQRHVLEVAYETLFSMGFQRQTLLEQACGMYVGHAQPEFNYAPKDVQIGGACGATGGAASITSNRISFSLGLKGPSITIDTEQASSLTAVYVATESVLQKGRNTACNFSVACGASLMVAPIWWPHSCATGMFSRMGRTCTFDASADGHIRADAFGGVVVKPMKSSSSGVRMVEDDDPDTFQGLIAGGMLNNSGRVATLNMPHVIAEQEVLLDAMHSAVLSPKDIDFVEAVAPGIAMHDAVEAHAVSRMFNADNCTQDPLLLKSGKPSICHSLDSSGVQLLIKNLRSVSQALVHPQLHLRILNPYISFAGSENIQIATESLTYRMDSAFFANKARGFGGVNVAIIGWNRSLRGLLDTGRGEPEQMPCSLSYWPADTGVPEAIETYFLVGSWSAWQTFQRMDLVAPGRYSLTVALEHQRHSVEFQITMDTSFSSSLCPVHNQVGRGSGAVLSTDGSNSPRKAWVVDLVDEEDSADRELPCNLQVLLRVSGDQRSVTWRKLPDEA